MEKCANACSSVSIEQPCGGTVLQCLSDKIEEITAEDCKKEVFYFQKMEVRDFRNDVILAETCRADVDAYCADVEAGDLHYALQLLQSPKGLPLHRSSSDSVRPLVSNGRRSLMSQYPWAVPSRPACNSTCPVSVLRLPCSLHCCTIRSHSESARTGALCLTSASAWSKRCGCWKRCTRLDALRR